MYRTSQLWCLLSIALGISQLAAPVAAQTSGTSVSGAKATQSIRLFLGCTYDGCFESFLKQSLSYFDFVRDRQNADLVVVVARQRSGNAGVRYTITLQRRGVTSDGGAAQEAYVSTSPDEQDVSIRSKLLRVLLRLLFTELATTKHADDFQVILPTRSTSALSSLTDPWNYWVLAPEFAAAGDGGSGYRIIELSGKFTIRRVTEKHKIRLRGAYQRRLSQFDLEEGKVATVSPWAAEGRAIYALALSPRWSLGAVGTGRSSEADNLKGHFHGGPLLEFNVFPYSENASHQFRFAYQAGAWANWYQEPNVRGKSRELRPYHALSVIIDANRDWGSVTWAGQVNSFIDQPKLARVSGSVGLSVRIFEGLAIGIQGTVAMVRDQISLRARPLSDVERLLLSAQQPTGYTFAFTSGISYTFGSLHNSIVNTRFALVDLDEE